MSALTLRSMPFSLTPEPIAGLLAPIRVGWCLVTLECHDYLDPRAFDGVVPKRIRKVRLK
jgi:hypothetical protein